MAKRQAVHRHYRAVQWGKKRIERFKKKKKNTIRLRINERSDQAIYHRVNGTHKHMTMKTMNAHELMNALDECERVLPFSRKKKKYVI